MNFYFVKGDHKKETWETNQVQKSVSHQIDTKRVLSLDRKNIVDYIKVYMVNNEMHEKLMSKENVHKVQGLFVG